MKKMIPPLPHAPATLRNRLPILAALKQVLPTSGLLLEIASGTGEHANFMAPSLPGWNWQPSEGDQAKIRSVDERNKELPSVLGCLLLDSRQREWPCTRADAVLCVNMVHIAPWSACLGLVEGAARILGEGGLLMLYGPFTLDGGHTAASNASFDRGLRAQNKDWGVRDLGEIADVAGKAGFSDPEILPMPANNITAVFRRKSRAP
jgi:hypothetical protein